MLILSLLSLLLPVSASHLSPFHHHAKRASDANTGDKVLSFYDANVGPGACGSTAATSDFVVAMNVPQWNAGANCYKEITIAYNGKTTNAEITDECMHCPYGGLDLNRALFDFFEDTDVGIIHGSWSFAGDATTTQKQTTSTSTTSHTSTSSSTTSTTKETSTTPTTTATTKISSSSAAIAASATESTAAATPTPSTQDTPQIMAHFSDTLVNLLGLVVQGARTA
ncbi:RlpA-like double-psi beta-barrel-protein domain-containing protein-containing protein [Mycena crocata]|nr:RlpA-like double-psi beta-barrel-protein domain-containing protein-containing protein [Mycena crocata]